ncbi:MAG TPA: glycosyltransferase family 2 protein [Candidatus Andersenbacteria bacterium]|nr:glycosyltransferase family 2 protein [Candidatus Andersenbacteria bacterium]
MHKMLAVIIPALNEEKTIGSVIDRIPQSFPGIAEVSIIVVNDGSTDSTETIAQQKGSIVISHAISTGVGYAFQAGIKKALEIGADYIVNIDADGQFNPEDIPTLLAPILSGKVEFVTATRFAKAEYMPQMPAIKIWGNKWMVRIINTITAKNFTDVSCGFRAYSREAALRLTLFGRFTYTQESFIDLAFKGVPMAEVPLKVRGEREFGTSRVASNLWRYAIKSATIIFHAARDYKPFYFIGAPGIVMLLIGVCSGIFILWHFIATGQTSPYRSLVTASGIFMIIGFLLIFISFIADMTHRNRVLIEETLYLARKNTYAQKINNEHQSN